MEPSELNAPSEFDIAATPILSLASPLPPPKKHVILGIVFGVIFGFCLGPVLDLAQKYAGGGIVLWAAVMLLPAILAHELGHTLAGILVGMPITGISVGPITLSWEYGTWQFVRGRGGALAGYAAVDIGCFRNVRYRVLWFIAGGPLGSIVSGLVAMVSAVFIAKRGGHGATPLMGYAFAALFLFLGGTLWFGKRGKASDFRRLYDLLFVRREILRMFSLVALQHAMHAGARAKNLNRRWLKSALEIKDGTAFELIANLYTYSHHCALKQTNEAALHLERCLQLVDVVRPLVRIILISAAASFVAWHWDDAPKATEWRKRLKTENGLPFLSRLGLDVSMCCAERDFAKAVELWNEGINFIERIPDATARLVQEGPWREWGKEIEERRMAADG